MASCIEWNALRCGARVARITSGAGFVVVAFALSLGAATARGQVVDEACCLPGGGCAMMPRVTCLEQGGTPQGPTTTCVGLVCDALCAPTPTGDRCEPVTCTDPGQQCVPTQVLCAPTGPCRVVDCNCAFPGGCHIDLDPPFSPFCAPGQCPDGSPCEHVITTLPTQETLHECVCPLTCAKPAPAGDDCWSTPCGNTKYDFALTPIPAGFFGSGSDPFAGVVQLGGSSGFIDTVVARRGDMCFDGPLPVTQTVPVELVQLDLQSCQPITVTFNGGQNPQPWNLKVSLLGTTQPLGSLVVTKSQPNGGTYDASLQVRPQFFFSNALGGLFFQPGIVMPLNSTGIPWTQDLPPFGGICGNGGFYPGYSPDDPTCCPESCHAGPAPGHDHCVFPPKCPQCPPAGQTCLDPTRVEVNTTTTVTEHGGWFEFVAATNATSIETCGSSFDTILEVRKSDCVTLLGANDDCSDGPFGAGSDPNASCYQSPDNNERDSCLCVPTVPGEIYKVRVKAFPDAPPPAGSTIVLTITKKNACGPVCLKGAPAGEDCWSTPCGATQYDFAQTPIPADFFGPASDPFTGKVQLGGSSGFFDTVIARLGDMCFDGALPVTQQVPIELIQLDLASCQPITVTFNGGQTPQQWNVRVTPDGPQPQGSMTVIKRDPNGGVFDSVLPVKPQFEFTVGPASLLFQPGQVQNLTVHATPWVQEAPPFGGICGSGGFFPGVSPADPTCCVESCHDGPAPGHEHCVIQPKCPQCPPTPVNPCEECGPGQHWIHNPPCPPGGVGEDLIPSGATLGIDTDFDCIADTSVVLGGPVVIRKRGPLDDSNQFPGIALVDGHRDVIDTEILSMTLTGGGVTLTAGAGNGAQPLRPTRGAIVEQPADPNLADSFFEVFAEVRDAGGFVGYNHTPLRVETKINCLPPDGEYMHVSGCTPIYDSPLPGAVQVGNLVTARHFTYPDCCFDTFCVPSKPVEACLAQGGTPVSECLGDNNGNGIDDACEPECGPTPGGERCQPVDCPNATEACTSTKVVCMPDAVCRIVNCECRDPERCHIELSSDGSGPVCAGFCPPGTICDQIQTDTNGDGIPDTFECICGPGQTPPCDECGPGAHWIHQPPCPPGGIGQDVLPSGATIGIDTDFDCIADTSVRLGGPVTIRKRGPLDDSAHFPGSATVDGHQDVVDTEIIAMSLTGGGITMTAGAGLGATPLRRSLGTVVEQPTDPLLADSFFDVFVEVRDATGFVGYNHAPLRVETKVDCLPPNGDYIHTSGCTPIFDSPLPGATQVGNLVTARHFTYPDCCLDTTCVPELPPDQCQALGGTLVPECLGDNNNNGIDDACEPPPPDCGPTPDGQACEPAACPTADQACTSTKVVCTPGAGCRVVECQCQDPERCHIELPSPTAPPICVGFCPPGETCVELSSDTDGDGIPDTFECLCRPVPTDPCEECGPGPHWIDQPGCPPGGVGQDVLPSGATIGIDTDFDCIADTSVRLGGPVTIRKRGPMDDSNQFPGSAPVDGHNDVIDTEILSMNLTGGGVSLTAGAGQGLIPLQPSLGAIIEQAGDPALADSFFDVFVEVRNATGFVGYNHAPLHVATKIDCLPPDGEYIHTSGCTPIYDAPFSGAVQVGNLVTARHFTYPACCFGTVCVPFNPPEACIEQGGTLVPDCLGDNNNNGIDDACEPPPPDCGPTPDGQACEPAECPTTEQACTSTKVVCTPNGVCRVVQCECRDPDQCHIELTAAAGPICVGFCPPGEICNRLESDTNGDGVPDTFECMCAPEQTPQCDECGPGVHWIHEPPCPPGGVGQDVVPSGATIGIDTDFDCIADTSVRLGGPVTIRKRGPLDDSAHFPGSATVDGHQDVVDTEIIAMSLTGGGITLTAGAGLGATPLQPSLGAVVEQPTDPLLADSFFDVFVEVRDATGFVGYNHAPLRVETKVDCLPPNGDYIHTSGCTPIFDSPLPGATQVGNLVTARHFTYPACCFGPTCVPDVPAEACLIENGTPVPDCLGDNNNNGIDDACEPPPPPCEPTPNGDACNTTECPIAGEVCVPILVECIPGGPCRVLECECRDPNACHVDLDPPFSPFCTGDCPLGTVCQMGQITGPNGVIEFACDCVAVDCGPNANGSACEPAACPVSSDRCSPTCVNFDPTTGATRVDVCECQDPNECHVGVTGGPVAAGGPANPCTVPDNGTGTVTLPPPDCAYLSPDDVHLIIDGLPAGTTIVLGAMHDRFIIQNTGPGGNLGGQFEQFNSFLTLNMQGTGALTGFNRTVMMAAMSETHTGPRTLGDPVQSFDTDMFRLQGELPPGDPDFCVLKVTGGTDNGLPSPGHTTLTRLGGPGSSFVVDSFFDVTYRIEFQGCLGSALENMSGVTTGTVRMGTGDLPDCVGGCPAGEVCSQTVTPNGDGTLSVCCRCDQAVEACCLPSGGCDELPPAQCAEMGGEPLGPGSVCEAPEACCIVGDVASLCINTDPRCCEIAGGIPQGPDGVCTQRQACCLPDGICLETDPLCCDEMGGTPQGANTHCDDGCPPPPFIVHAEGQPGETQPCSGYIDPKVDSDDGVNVNRGLRKIALRFSEPVFALGGGPLTPASFAVTETGGAAPPTVSAIDDSANPLIVLEFSRHITVLEWTTTRAIVQNAAGIQIKDLGDLGNVNESDRHDVGYMPCDVDQTGACGPFDLLKFRQYVNSIAVPPCGILLDYVDINRNNILDPFDLLVFRQMVNGVSPPTTRVWSGVSMNNVRP